jgi:hypothetical protein
MLDDQTYPFACFGQFLLRTPALPFHVAEDLTAKEDTSEDQIMSYWKEDIIKEAIYLASPGLYAQLERLADGKVRETAYTGRLVATLLKYLLRMSCRPTPFGLFAGVNTGAWENKTEIELRPSGQARVHLQLDMQYLCWLAEKLAENTRIRNQMRYYPNSSAYRAGNAIRFVDYKQEDGKREHHIVEIAMDEGLELVLKEAKHGRKVGDLKSSLVNAQYDDMEAGYFITELIDSQVLLPELQAILDPSVFLDDITRLLERIEGTKLKHKILVSIRNDLKQESPCGQRLIKFKRISKELSKVDGTYSGAYIIQADMEKKATACSIDREVEKQLKKSIFLLKALNPSTASPVLGSFCKSFTELFGLQEIPLLRALDPEIGIPYGMDIHQVDPSPLIDDLRLPKIPDESKKEWTPVDELLLTKYLHAVKNQQEQVHFSASDLQKMAVDLNDLPPTFNVCFSLLGNKREEVKALVHWAGGAVATSMIGRFCHLNASIYEHAVELARQEALHYPDAILAEIIHLPEGRTGNILQRPPIRDYDIPYLAKSTLAEKYQVPVSDLLVSVRENHAILTSRQHGKRIIPRLSSAHNYARNAIPVYRFLCDLQSQGIQDNLSFSWGMLESRFTHFPRVTFENTILCPAMWRYSGDALSELQNCGDDTQAAEILARWMREDQLPGKIILADFDNELPLNLKNRNCVQILLQLINGRDEVLFKEWLFEPGTAITRCGREAFNHEIIASFHKTTMP